MAGKGHGIGRYVEQLILNLQKIDVKNQYVLFVRKDFKLDGLDLNRFEIIEADIPWYSWREQIEFTKIIKKAKLDLMHWPHWNIPVFYSGPFVATIHDLTMFHFPRPEATMLGPVKFWLKDKAHRFVVKRAVKKAKRIITTSEFTKYDIHKTLGVPNEKMTVVYQAPFVGNMKSVFLDQREKIRNPKQILDKYKISKPYVLYAGAAYPHKNLEKLMEAWKILGEKFDDEYQLVLAGKDNYFYKRLRQQCNNVTMKQCKNVIFIGFISDEDLADLYEQADLYVFPSLYEGFGLSPLEAMAHGVPVASSNSSCLPEVLGEGAIYFDPNDAQNMADTIKIGLENEEIRHQLFANGSRELKKYSLEKMIKQTLSVYWPNCG